MSNMIATCLNEEGQAYVKAELKRLGLDWNVSATCSEIEEKESFGGLVSGEGDSMDYEIRNISAGKTGYGVFAYLEIQADKHVRFEPVDL